MAAAEGPAAGEVTALLAGWREGDRDAADRLFTLVYEELRRVAHRALADQRNEATLRTTALVHETYLRLVGSFRPAHDDRRRFFAAAAKAMRRILIDRARERLALKRGAGERPLELREADHPSDADASEALAVDEALAALEQHQPRLAELVELRFFAGFSVEECAELLGVSERTVKRDWQRARGLLADWFAGPAGAAG